MWTSCEPRETGRATTPDIVAQLASSHLKTTARKSNNNDKGHPSFDLFFLHFLEFTSSFCAVLAAANRHQHLSPPPADRFIFNSEALGHTARYCGMARTLYRRHRTIEGMTRARMHVRPDSVSAISSFDEKASAAESALYAAARCPTGPTMAREKTKQKTRAPPADGFRN